MNDYKKLIEKYSVLYSKNMYFECEIGWYDLIDRLSAALEPLIIRLNHNSQVKSRVVQVKEKWRTLRFYMSFGTDEIFNLIEEYEIKSETVCEKCGEEGKIRKGRRMQALCDKHDID